MKKPTIGVILFHNINYYPTLIELLRILSTSYNMELVTAHMPSEGISQKLKSYGVRIVEIPRKPHFIVNSIFYCSTKQYSALIGVDAHGFFVAALRSLFGKLCPLFNLQYELYLANEWNGLTNKFETLFLRYANLVACVEPNRAILLQQKCNLHTTPTVILNCPSLMSETRKKADNNVRDEFELEDNQKTFILIYQGGLSSHQCIEELITSATMWMDGIKLMMFGYGPENRIWELKKLTIDLNVQNRIFWREQVGNDKIIKYTNAANAGIVFWDGENVNYKYAAPNKLFEYLRSGLPVIASRNPLIVKVVEKNNLGICVHPRSPDQIANAINDLFSKPLEEYNGMSKRAVTLFATIYNYENQSKEFINGIRKVVN